MDLELSSSVETEQQFWDELDGIVSKEHQTHELIDNTLRSYLSLTTHCRGDYVNSDYDIARCSYKILCSRLFEQNGDYIRRQIVHCLLQDDAADVLHMVTAFLLYDARENEATFELMSNEGAFPRLVDLIHAPREDEEGLHRLLMELLYEMSRIQRIKPDDLTHVNDEFVSHLFHIIEDLSHDVNDPYHYPVIRVLLVLNEQFMVLAHDPDPSGPPSVPITNKVIKILSSQGSKYKTFGENIILLLNRESETSLQLLTLKLLYLLFTTPLTYEYFYTNDLHVLVDILIRNLLDLPEDASALRHTYLRVLYPLLSHTQLRHAPHYKREEIRKLLAVLARGQAVESSDAPSPESNQWRHFEEVDETTKRLVNRCSKVLWLQDLEEPDLEPISKVESPVTEEQRTTGLWAPVKSDQKRPELPAPRKLSKRGSSQTSNLTIGPFLTPNLKSASKSNLSVLQVASHKEKPGVMTPSRKDRLLGTTKREKPLPPKARRWGRKKDEKRFQNAPDEDVGDDDDTQPDATNVGVEYPVEPEKLNGSEVKSEQAKSGIAGTIVEAPVAAKKPPPAPKARRWRGKKIKKEGEGEIVGGVGSGRDRSATTTKPTPEQPLPKMDTMPPRPAMEETLSGAEVGSPGGSVTIALSDAHAAALSSISETLANATLDENRVVEEEKETKPDTELEQGLELELQREQVQMAKVQQEQETEKQENARVATVTMATAMPGAFPEIVLAPPNPAPARQVRGPRFSVERSPFIGDGEDEDSGRE